MRMVMFKQKLGPEVSRVHWGHVGGSSDIKCTGSRISTECVKMLIHHVLGSTGKLLISEHGTVGGGYNFCRCFAFELIPKVVET